MKFTISTYDLRTFTSVLWYCEKLKNNIEHHMYLEKCMVDGSAFYLGWAYF